MPNFTGQFERNTDKLIALLTEVNFQRSRLPKELLKPCQADPNLCEMEHTIQVRLLGKLENDSPRRIHADFGPIDEKLIELAEGLIRYVRSGEAVSAQITCDALQRGIRDIRCSIPQNQKISQEKFVSVNASYLARWIQLVQWAELYDQQYKSLLAQQAAHDQDFARLDASIDSICARIESEPDFRKNFFYILDHGSLADRSSWSQAHREVHQLLVQHRVDRFTLELSKRSLDALKQDLTTTRQRIDTLRVTLRQVPIVTDPDMMNDYQEAMEQAVKEFAQSDALMEETLHQLEKLTGALEQLDQSSSVLRQQQAAAESARSTLEQIRQHRQQSLLQSQEPPLRSHNHN